jgi:hypothetical protein
VTPPGGSDPRPVRDSLRRSDRTGWRGPEPPTEGLAAFYGPCSDCWSEQPELGQSVLGQPSVYHKPSVSTPDGPADHCLAADGVCVREPGRSTPACRSAGTFARTSSHPRWGRSVPRETTRSLPTLARAISPVAPAGGHENCRCLPPAPVATPGQVDHRRPTAVTEERPVGERRGGGHPPARPTPTVATVRRPTKVTPAGETPSGGYTGDVSSDGNPEVDA